MRAALFGQQLRHSCRYQKLIKKKHHYSNIINDNVTTSSSPAPYSDSLEHSRSTAETSPRRSLPEHRMFSNPDASQYTTHRPKSSGNTSPRIGNNTVKNTRLRGKTQPRRTASGSAPQPATHGSKSLSHGFLAPQVIRDIFCPLSFASNLLFITEVCKLPRLGKAFHWNWQAKDLLLSGL